MGILSRSMKANRNGQALPAEVELTREVLREFVGSSEHVLRAWFQEELGHIFERRDVAEGVAAEVQRRLTRAVGEVGSVQAQQLLAGLHELVRQDRGLLRKGLEQVVSDAVAREVLATYTRDRVAWGDWTRAFSFDCRRVAREALPAAAAWRDTPVWTERPEGLLPRPLDEHLERDPYPLPHPEDREGYYGERHLEYWISGLLDELRLLATLREHGVELAPGDALLDFGCASGRVLRHFLCQEQGLDCWGADIDRNAIDWIHRHLPTGMRAFQCTVLPQLPLPDASFRLVYALSVFTHIDEFEQSWLCELRRILKPGGIAYLTIHSDDTWAGMNPGWGVYRHLLANRDAIHEHDVGPELFTRPMPTERVVFRWRTAALNNTDVFVTKEHVHRTWGRFFEVLEIRPRASGYQDAVVLRRL